jgi:chromatin modification-related protein VID21
LNEQSIPSRQDVGLESLQQSLVLLGYGPTLALPRGPSLPANKEAHRTKPSPKPTVDAKQEPKSTPVAPAQAPQPLPVEAKTTPVSHVPLPNQGAAKPAVPVDISSAQASVSSSHATKPSQPPPATTKTIDKPRPTPATALQKPPAQVTFTPDVKSPTPKQPPAKDEKKDKAPVAEEQTVIPPPIKVPTDLARAPDALSSPGSTAQSATTPGGIHDRSTDTSPDHEGPAYPEGEGKHAHADQPESEDSQRAEAPNVPPTVDETPESPESAEAQLLQESSTAAVNSAAAKELSAVEKVAEKPTQETSAQSKREEQERPEEQATPNPEVEVGPSALEKEEDAHDVAKSVEIPDSREETPEAMDVDTSEPATKEDAVAPVTATTEVKAPAQREPATPTPKAAPAPEAAPQPAERAITRVSSGALKPKSVNEIVGGLSRPPPTLPKQQQPPATTDHIDDQLTPITSTPQSPASRLRRTSLGRKDKSKGQVSAVLFGKQSKRTDESALMSGSNEAIHPSDDYYTPLFVQGFAGSSNWMQPMEKILHHANKTVTTPDVNLCIQDHQACKVLRRVYHLQSSDKWSLRQPKRCPEPTRPPSHWDVLLQEAKWMRTDFREERKWKRMAASNLAVACAEWCAAAPEERKAMQVDAFIPPKPTGQEDVEMASATEDPTESQATPDLISGDAESPQAMDELAEVINDTVAPSAIFSLQDDDVVFGLRRTAAADQLLEELPIFGAPLKVPRSDPTAPEYDPDARWRRPALPLSKYVEGHMKLNSEGPPRKRSRYNYVNEDSADEDESDFASRSKREKVDIPPESDAVALFNPEMKHIRDRLHAGHQFRPPTDHPMPTQSFYECRNPSMWMPAEDDELRGLVREYSYNWPLISSMLTSRSIYSSGAERRTPWECFERWIQLEGLPSDMQKTQYFRAYTARIEAAQRTISQQNQAAAQQSTASGAPGPPIRRRQSTPMRVERRRNQKHLTLMDAMRKVAKKREATAQKQQQAASQNAANKKPDSVAQAQRTGPSKTPRDYSLLRWERDQHLAEKMAMYANRQDATRRVSAVPSVRQDDKTDADKVNQAAVMQARAQSQAQRSQAGAAAGPNAHPAAAAMHAANGNHRPNAAAQAAAMRNQAQQPRMQMAPPGQTPNGMAGAATPQLPSGLVPAINGTPQAQMQNMQAPQRMQVPNQQANANLMMRAAQQISEQQRAAVQMANHMQAQQMMQQQQQLNLAQQQQQQNGNGNGTPRPTSQHNSPPNMVNGGAVNGVNGVNVNGLNQQNYMNNTQAGIAQFNNANGGHASPPANVHLAAGSPRPQMQIPPALANQISVLEAQFRAKNPNISPDQARQLATEHLVRAMAAQRHSAMNAAAGASGQHGMANGMAATTSPHQYAALLRQQQQQQQAAAAQQQQHPTPAGNASQAASSPGQLSQASHQRQPSESGTPSAAP